MTDDFKDIIDIHDKNGYCVKIFGLENKVGCSVQFPSNYLIDKPFSNLNYKYIITKNGINIYVHEDDKIVKEIEHTCPDTARRVLILEDVILKCLGLKISMYLIKIKNENNETVHLKDLFKILKAPKQIKKEKLLKDYMIDILNGGQEVAVEGLDDELEQNVLKLLLTGGF